MARKRQPESFADLVQNWEGLLRAYDENADRLTPAQPQRQILEAALGHAQEVKARQLAHIGAKQRASQEILGAVRDGKEAARCMRNAVKANVGTDNEILTQFQIAPRRPRSHKAPPAEPPPQAVEAPAKDPSEPPGE